MKGEIWGYSNEEVLCFHNGEVLGNEKNLIAWAQEEFNYEDFRPSILYDAIAQEAYRDFFVQNPVNTLPYYCCY